MIDAKTAAKNVFDSDEFKNWNKEDNYLVSCVFINNKWNVDFYSKNTKMMTSFIIDDDIKIGKGDKIFQKETKDLEELELDSVNVSLEDAEGILEKTLKEKRINEYVVQKIIILQKIKLPMWNITYITSGFNLLNVKINATNKDTVEESLSHVFGFGK